MSKKRGLDIDEKVPAFKHGINHLLAIAVNDYQHAPKLSNCVGDAQQIIDILVSKYDFETENVRTLFNKAATRANIYKQLRQLSLKIKPQDNLLIYFAGHGIYDKEGSAGYLVPVEAAPGNFWDFVSNGDFLSLIRAIKSFHTFLLMDSCFSGTLFRSMEEGSTHLAENVEQYPSRWGLAAGRVEEVEDGWHGENSPFAKAVIQYLEANDSPKFPASELVQYTKRVTPRNARQTPVGGPLFKVGDMDGEFVFYLKRDEELPMVEAMHLDIKKGEELLYAGKYRDARRLFNGLLKEVEEEFQKDVHKKALTKKISDNLDLCKHIPKYKPFIEKGIKSSFQEKVSELQKLLAQKEDELKQLQTQLKEEKEGKTAEVKKLRSELRSRQSEITKLKKSLQGLGQLEQEHNEQKGHVKLLEGEIKVNKKKILTLEQSINKKDSQIEDLLKEVEKLKTTSKPVPEPVKPSAGSFAYAQMIPVKGGSMVVKGEKFKGIVGLSEALSRGLQVQDFLISKHPVTYGEFAAFVQATNYETDAEKSGWAYVYKSPTWGKKYGVSWRFDERGQKRTGDSADFPVLFVSWNDAHSYCQWLSKKTGAQFRLPSEAEWEFAARGGTLSRSYNYSGSNKINSVGWYTGNSELRLHKVGEKRANELGIYDMSGNVFEWCEDWYAEKFPSETGNPPMLGVNKVIRGGSWYGSNKSCVTSYRSFAHPDHASYHIGFRIAQNATNI